MADKQRFFTEKITLITGGSSGIGLALAKQLTAQGARVWIAGRRKDVLTAAGTEVQNATGRTCNLFPADVSDASQAARLVEEITRRDGLPDLVINSAGVTQPGYVQELGLDVFHQMMDINYFGTVNVVKAVLPGMMARRSGHIVNISSMAGYQAAFGYSAYSASKYAVVGFSEVLRAEMKFHGIHVSVVFPPDTDTPQLAYEEPFKPPETKAIAGVQKALSAEKVAGDILKQAARGQFLIFPGSDSRFFYLLTTKLPKWLVFAILDQLAAKGKKQTMSKPT